MMDASNSELEEFDTKGLTRLFSLDIHASKIRRLNTQNIKQIEVINARDSKL